MSKQTVNKFSLAKLIDDLVTSGFSKFSDICIEL